MFTLRATIRCKSALNKVPKHKLQIRNMFSLTNALVIPRSTSVTQWLKQASSLNVSVNQKSFATTPAKDIETKDLERIYYGTLTPRMRVVKVFSLTTSLAGLAAQPILMEQGMKMGGTGMAVFLCTFAGFFTFITPLLLHFVTKKYVTEIHYNPSTEEYVATTINIILQRVKTIFRPSDVNIPEVPGMFTSFYVGKRALFVDPALFNDPEHYVRIMGYDKPIDFKLNLKESNAPETHDVNKAKK